MKITPIQSTKQLTKVFLKSKPNAAALPIVTAPIIAYYVGESQDKHAAEILEFFKRKYIKIPSYLEPHPDTKAGFSIQSQTKIKEALANAYNDNKISAEDYKKYKNMVTFTGHSDITDSADGIHGLDNNIDTDIDVDDDGSFLDAILDFLDDLF